MSREDLSPQPDRSEFTFFPNQNPISQGNTNDFADHVARQMKALPPIMHELWRTNRDEDIYELGGKLSENILKREDMRYNFAMSIASASHYYGRNVAEFKAFVKQSSEQLVRGSTNLPIGPLDKKTLRELGNFYNEVISRAIVITFELLSEEE